MKKSKIVKIILIIICIVVGLFYFYKIVTNSRVAGVVILGHVNNYQDENVQIKREAKNDQEMKLILAAEKIKCIKADGDCFDLTNIDRDIMEARFFNKMNLDSITKKIIYEASVERMNEYDDSLAYWGGDYFDSQFNSVDKENCIERVGKEGFRVDQYYYKFRGKTDPDTSHFRGNYYRVLFFNNKNKYICGNHGYLGRGF
jgi:uncharacterized protein YxeA